MQQDSEIVDNKKSWSKIKKKNFVSMHVQPKRTMKELAEGRK